MPALSIIIPTHKRAATLRRCLEHLEKQTIADQLEVIVVSDGHDDETADLFKGIFHFPFSIFNFLEIPKSQQGVARNRGVEHATAPLTLFTGDDIFLAPDACEKHVRAHAEIQSNKILNSKFLILHSAVLGHTTWDPEVEITEVMRWLESSGWQFGYPFIEKYSHQFMPKEIQNRFTYTSHISLPTEIARANPFREDVSLYGWEDIEWGLRLTKAGVRLFYEPDARALHHHHMTLEDSLKRMETLGRSSKFFPDLNVVPRGWKALAYQLLSLLPTMRGRHSRAFLEGIKMTKTLAGDTAR